MYYTVVFLLGALAGTVMMGEADETRFTIAKDIVVSHGCAEYQGKNGQFVWKTPPLTTNKE